MWWCRCRCRFCPHPRPHLAQFRLFFSFFLLLFIVGTTAVAVRPSTAGRSVRHHAGPAGLTPLVDLDPVPPGRVDRGRQRTSSRRAGQACSRGGQQLHQLGRHCGGTAPPAARRRADAALQRVCDMAYGLATPTRARAPPSQTLETTLVGWGGGRWGEGAQQKGLGSTQWFLPIPTRETTRWPERGFRAHAVEVVGLAVLEPHLPPSVRF